MEDAAYKLLHTPEGVRDLYYQECEKKLFVQSSIEKVMRRYGYQPIQTPTFEFYDIFGKERGTANVRDMYKLIDKEGELLVLRPDITPSIARCAAKYFKEETLPVRLFYLGNTFISNVSHQGKLNETTHAGAELINDDTVEADAEILALTVRALRQAGLKEFQVEVGHAQFFNGLMEEAGFSPDEVLRMKNLMESKNLFGIEAMVETKELPAPLRELLIKLPELFGSRENLEYARGKTQHPKAAAALERLEALYQRLEWYGLEDYITVDLGMLSRYDYYTGIILKAYTYGTGEPIAKGGRYDGLLGQFGKKAPAVGLAIVIDQLLLALDRQGPEERKASGGSAVLYDCALWRQAVSLAECLRETKPVVLMAKDSSGHREDYVSKCRADGVAVLYELVSEHQAEELILTSGRRRSCVLEELLSKGAGLKEKKADGYKES